MTDVDMESEAYKQGHLDGYQVAWNALDQMNRRLSTYLARVGELENQVDSLTERHNALSEIVWENRPW